MSHKQLTQDQRYQLYQMNEMGFLQKTMAKILGKSASTISRELRTNSGKRGNYLKNAHQLALARRKGKAKTRITEDNWRLIERFIKHQVSPEQISIRMKLKKCLSISPEWIYQYIHKDRQNKGLLYTHLRGKKSHRKQYGSHRSISNICNRVSIEERPQVVDKRKRYGDWEVDTVIGRQGGKVLVTLVERKSKLSLIGLSINKKAHSVKEVIVNLLASFSTYVHTLTYDNGPEFAQHEAIDKALKSQGYFAHPFCSGERGLSENTNGLIRQYLPKKSSFDKILQEEIERIMHRLNNRPRKALSGKTPNEVFFSGKRIAIGS